MKPCDQARTALDAAAADGDPAVILSATLYLMSCYACNGCPRLAVIVSRHLRALERLETTTEPLRTTCKQLCARWEEMAKPVVTPCWLARLAGQSVH